MGQGWVLCVSDDGWKRRFVVMRRIVEIIYGGMTTQTRIVEIIYDGGGDDCSKVTFQPVSAYGHPIYTFTQQIFCGPRTEVCEYFVISKIPHAKKANGGCAWG